MNDIPLDPAIAALIRTTLKSLGDVDPSDVPHRLRDMLASQVGGDIDVNRYITEMKRLEAVQKAKKT